MTCNCLYFTALVFFRLYFFAVDLLISVRNQKRAIAKALQLKGHSDFAPVDLAYYQHFLGFLFENIAFWEVLPGNQNADLLT